MSEKVPDSTAGSPPTDGELFGSLLEYSNDAMWVFTPDWSELVYVNGAYEDIFGSPVEELADEPTSFLEQVHPADRDLVTERMERLSEGESVELEYRVDPSTDFGTWVWVDGQPLRDEDGDLEYVAGYTRDVTERKQYEKDLERYRDQLEQSNESLKEFAYVASHDLQEPLRMISSYVDLLEVEYGDELDEEASEYMEFAVDGAQRMKAMIDSLLTYSRVHTEDQDLESVDTAELLEDVRHDLHHRIEETGTELSVDDPPTVEAYPDQLAQVFQNLLKNAIDHASENGPPRIEVTATERSDVVEFAVADDGPGIAAADQDDVFDIFRQVDHNDEDGGNSGIGLSIVKRIVERHGGEVWIESAAGEGATFRFTIPQDGPGPITEEEVA